MKQIICALAFVFGVSMAHATLWLNDGVPIGGAPGGYTAGSRIYNTEPVIFGETGRWLTDTGVMIARGTANALNYSGVPSSLTPLAGSGAYAVTHDNNNTGEMRYTHRKLSLIPAETNIYFSALMAFEAGAFDYFQTARWAGVGLSTNAATSNGISNYSGGFCIAFQKLNTNGVTRVRLVADAGSNMMSAPIILHDNPQADVTYMVIARVVYNPNGPEEISFALNPVPGVEVFSETRHAELLNSVNKLEYLCLSTSYALHYKHVYTDEIRAASTFEDVVGEPLSVTSFIGKAEASVDNGVIGVTFALGSYKAGSPLRLLMGTANGVWSITNNITSNIAIIDPITIIPQGIDADTAYFYNIVAEDDPAEPLFSGAAPATFLNGEIWLSAASDSTSELDLQPAVITIHRVAADVSAPLTVNYAVTNGTAEAGIDFANVHAQGILTIPAGAASATITITPLLNYFKLYDTSLGVNILPGAYRLGASTHCDIFITNAPPPVGYSVWVGDGNADIAANWYPRKVPGADDHVLLGAYSTKNITIPSTSPMTVASWTQEAEYNGIVTFNCPFDSATPQLVVLGDCAVDSNGSADKGMWTHAQSKTAENWKVFVEVRGNMTFSGYSTIEVYAKGFGTSNGPGGTSGSGAAYGGENSNFTNVTAKTYGSIFAPLRYGSTGANDKTAGGVIQLVVDGTLAISANAVLNANGNQRATGGSIFIKAGKVIGAGTITASAVGEGTTNVAGGGRIAIHLTGMDSQPSDFTGFTQAYGNAGARNYNYPAAGGGTVYWQNASEEYGAGTVLIRNAFQLSHGDSFERRSTILPPEIDCSDNFRQSNWIIRENGNLKLRESVAINSLWIDTVVDSASSIPTLRLNGQTLTTRSLKIGDQQISSGTYSAAQLGAHVVDNTAELGSVVILSQGTLIIIR